MHKVKLANGVEFLCEETQTILDAARKNDIAIEHSCKNGRCGICIAKVTKGETKAIRNEESISSDELSSNKILTCCRAPTNDINLNIRDLGEIGKIKTLTMPCRIDSISYYNSKVLKLILRLPPNNFFKFIPGQYLNLIIGDIKRSYSIANSPREDNKIELHVKKVESGKMSSILFSQSMKDDLLRFEGPLGTFSFRDDCEKNIIFLATGTGIAPIKALLESFEDGYHKKDIYVFWGAQYESDLYLDIKKLSSKIKFVPVLSRENINGFFYGHVQEAVLSLGIDLTISSVYACGSEEMIVDARKKLIKNGLLNNRFYSDAFVSSN